MAWFRHEDNARTDKAMKALVDEFGPLGELVWHRLLEVRCQADDDVVVTIAELAQELSLRPAWRFPLERWLREASRLGLIKTHRGRSQRRSIHIPNWTKYQPEWASKAAAAERQRRSRANRSQDGHSDNRVTSHSTDVRTDVSQKQDLQGVANRNGSATTATPPSPVSKADEHTETRSEVLEGIAALGKFPKAVGD